MCFFYYPKYVFLLLFFYYPKTAFRTVPCCRMQYNVLYYIIRYIYIYREREREIILYYIIACTMLYTALLYGHASLY